MLKSLSAALSSAWFVAVLVAGCSSSSTPDPVSPTMADAATDAPTGPVDAGVDAPKGPCNTNTLVTTAPDITHVKAPLAGAPPATGGMLAVGTYKLTQWVEYNDSASATPAKARATYEFTADGKFAIASKANGDPDQRAAGRYTATPTTLVLTFLPTGAVCAYPGTEMSLVYTATAGSLVMTTDNKLTGTDKILDVTTLTKQ